MFKDGFYWGGAVTAHQSEGAYTAGGKSPAVCDLIPLLGPSGFKKDTEFQHSDFRDGIDSYHRYDEDFALLEKLGFNSYRFSIDWSRVAPDGETFSEEGMQFYDDYIDSMVRHGMDPICSLYHFEMPQCLYEKYNGFFSRKVVDLFVRFSEKMIERYSDRVKKWVTFNEQNSIGDIGKKSKIAYGAVCPEGMDHEAFVYQLVHNTFVAHAKVVELIHRVPGCLALGMVIYTPAYAYNCNPANQLAAMNANANEDMYFEMFTYGEYSTYMMSKMKRENKLPVMEEGDLELLKNNTCDWLTLSYYFSLTVDTAGIVDNPFIDVSPWGWPIDPIGLRIGLRDLQAKYRLPLMVTENGIGMKDVFENGTVCDDERIAYMRAHIQAISDAIDDGVDCRGYLMWGPIDILSSHAEMDKRYGIVYVNRDNYDLKDMKRYKKKSADWFANVIRTNGKEL